MARVDSASNRNVYQECLLGVKCCRYAGLTTLHLHMSLVQFHYENKLSVEINASCERRRIRVFGPTKENQTWRAKTIEELDKLVKQKYN